MEECYKNYKSYKFWHIVDDACLFTKLIITQVAGAHSGAIEVEKEVEVEDEQIQEWLPDLDATTPTSSAAAAVVSTCMFVLTSFVLLR